ncbi:MAG: hypothetical protein WC551_01860 [Patescibacteria group bacterium]
MNRLLIVFAILSAFITGCTINLGGGGAAVPSNPEPQQVAAVSEAPAPVAENTVQPSEPAASPSVTPTAPFLPIRPSISAVRPANPVGSVQLRPPSRISRPKAPVQVCTDCVRRELPKVQTPIRRADPPRLINQPKKIPPKPEPTRGFGPTRLARR